MEGEGGKAMICYEFVPGSDTFRHKDCRGRFARDIFSQKNISNAIIKILKYFILTGIGKIFFIGNANMTKTNHQLYPLNLT